MKHEELTESYRRIEGQAPIFIVTDPVKFHGRLSELCRRNMVFLADADIELQKIIALIGLLDPEFPLTPTMREEPEYNQSRTLSEAIHSMGNVSSHNLEMLRSVTRALENLILDTFEGDELLREHKASLVKIPPPPSEPYRGR